MKASALLRAACALLLGVFMTILIGQFVGYPLDAVGAVANIARMNEIAEGHPQIAADALERIYAEEGFNKTNATTEGGAFQGLRSLLVWHALILSLTVLASLLFLRPSVRALLVAGAAMGGLLVSWAGWSVGLALLFPTTLYCVLPWSAWSSRARSHESAPLP